MNWKVGAVSIWFWLIETAYFGWNLKPGSDAEMVCDGLALLIFALALMPRNTVKPVNTHTTVNHTWQANIDGLTKQLTMLQKGARKRNKTIAKLKAELAAARLPPNGDSK